MGETDDGTDRRWSALGGLQACVMRGRDLLGRAGTPDDVAGNWTSRADRRAPNTSET